MSGKVGISGKAGMSVQACKSGLAGKLAHCSVRLPRCRFEQKADHNQLLDLVLMDQSILTHFVHIVLE